MALCLITVGKPQVTAFYQRLIKNEKLTTYNIEYSDKIFACPSAFQDPALRGKNSENDAGQMWYLDTLYTPVNQLKTLKNIQIADANRKNYAKDLANKLNNQEYDLIIFDPICILDLDPYKKILNEKYTEKKINTHTSIFIKGEVNKN